MAQIIVPDYQGAPVPIQENGDRDAFTTRDIEGAPYTWPAYSVENDPIMIRANEAYDLADQADGKADTAQARADAAHLLATEGLHTIVPAGGTIEGMSTEEADAVNLGTRVITSDGKVWFFKYDQAVATVDPLDPANYVEGADQTPEWAVIANKPEGLESAGLDVAALNTTTYGNPASVFGTVELTDAGYTILTDLGFTVGETVKIWRTVAPFDPLAGQVELAVHTVAPGDTVSMLRDSLFAQTQDAVLDAGYSGGFGSPVVAHFYQARSNGYAYFLQAFYSPARSVAPFGMANSLVQAAGGVVTKLDEIRQDVVVTPFTPAVQTGYTPIGSGATLLSSLGITDAHSPLTVYSFNPTLPPPGNPPVASGAFAFADVTGLTVQDLIDGINGAQSFCAADLDGSGQLRFTQTSTDAIMITFSAFNDVIIGCGELGFGALFTQIFNPGAESAPEHTKLIDADHVGVENVFTFGDRNDVQAELRAAKVSVDMKANTPNKRMSGYRARVPALVGTRTTLLSAVVGMGAINAGDTLTFSDFQFMNRAQQPVAPTVPYPPKTYTVVDPATETIGDVIDFFAEAYDYTCPVTTQGDVFATASNFGPDFAGAYAVAPNVVLSSFQISGALAYKLRLSGAPGGNYQYFSPVELTSGDVFMPEKGLFLSSTSTAIAEATTDGSGNFTMVFPSFYPFTEGGGIVSPIVLLDTKFFTGIVFKTGIAGYYPFRITGKVVDAALAPIAGITVLGMCFAASPSAL